MADDNWPDSEVEKLRALWGEGMPTAEIGRQMKKTKSSIIGKAHRLHLAPRNSPIKRAQVDQNPQPPKIERLPHPPSRYPTRIVSKEELRAIAPVAIKATLRAQPCCWPIGNPKQPDFRYCDAPGIPGKSYCIEHAKIAYVNQRDWRENAA